VVCCQRVPGVHRIIDRLVVSEMLETRTTHP
jgi:hypothetical protein